MKGWIRKTCVGFAVALALGTPVVHADGGTISFSGVVAESTCTTADVGPATPGVSRGGCGVVASQPASHASLYRQQLVALEGSVVDNRLLSYFAGYTSGDDTRLLTRVYD